jgi:hypothetical protein
MPARRSWLLMLVLMTSAAGPASAGWKMQEIGRDLGVVYAVEIADMNRDRRPDVVAISGTQVMWFEAPDFRKHVIADGVTERDNVCFAIEDIDSDGWPDIALGAGWQPPDTTKGGTLQWLRRRDRRNHDEPWDVIPILKDEPTLHRIRWGDLDGDGQNELVVKMLQGRGTKPPAFEGTPGARVLVLKKPKNPVRGPWKSELATDALHIAHNFFIDAARGPARPGTIVMASREGLTALRRGHRGGWSSHTLGEGAPGEVKPGRIGGVRHLVTIEPWHGTSLVVYRDPGGALGERLWPREVIEQGMTEGHAVGWGDFDGDGQDEIVAGWRKKPVGLAVYRRDDKGTWSRAMIDDGGMATEDLAVGNLDGDPRPEVVAGGRATSNVRVYRWTP